MNQPPRLGRDARVGMLLVLPGAAWLLVFAVAPLGFLVVMSFWRSTLFGLSTELTLANYRTLVADPVYATVLFHTLRIAVTTTLIALVISYPMALFLAALKGPVKTACVVLLFLPFWTSYVVRTFLWLPMLGRNGLINVVRLDPGLI